MINLKQAFKFITVSKKRFNSEKDHLIFQRHQGKLIIQELKEKGIDISKLNVLELGCGAGGYSVEFYKNSKKLTIADLEKPKELLKMFPDINFLQFDFCKKFPIKDNKYDFIFCASTIEHLKNPEFTLKEIYRILKKEGIAFISYPPFYSLVGGHQFKPYHLFGEKIALKIYNKKNKTNIKSYESFKLNKPPFGNWGLYRLKIKDGIRLVKQTNFKIKKVYTKFSPINFTKIPFLNEFLTWHVVILAEK